MACANSYGNPAIPTLKRPAPEDKIGKSANAIIRSCGAEMQLGHSLPRQSDDTQSGCAVEKPE